jgi:hypothetical protein
MSILTQIGEIVPIGGVFLFHIVLPFGVEREH